MKTVIKSTVAALALFALAAGPASAMVSQSDLTRNINSVTSSGTNIFANIQNGTVTLTGYYEDGLIESQVLQAALSTHGVERVINHATQSN